MPAKPAPLGVCFKIVPPCCPGCCGLSLLCAVLLHRRRQRRPSSKINDAFSPFLIAPCFQNISESGKIYISSAYISDDLLLVIDSASVNSLLIFAKTLHFPPFRKISSSMADWRTRVGLHAAG